MTINELNRYELETAAYYLYDGGWRANDREWLKDEYKLTDEKLDIIVEALKDLEKANR